MHPARWKPRLEKATRQWLLKNYVSSLVKTLLQDIVFLKSFVFETVDWTLDSSKQKARAFSAATQWATMWMADVHGRGLLGLLSWANCTKQEATLQPKLGVIGCFWTLLDVGWVASRTSARIISIEKIHNNDLTLKQCYFAFVLF